MPTKDIGDRLLLKPDSVRSHLKAVFAKTGAHSQVELVHMLLSSTPAALISRWVVTDFRLRAEPPDVQLRFKSEKCACHPRVGDVAESFRD